MRIPVEIDFKGFDESEAQRVEIAQHLSKVERRFGGIISGRAVVKATVRHHREGAPLEILIRLKLPAGREVDVSQTPGEDERYANFNFAMSDAFRRAERQLRDAVKRMQGEVKSSSEQPIGTVRRSRSGTRVPIARRDQQPCPSSKAGARR